MATKTTTNQPADTVEDQECATPLAHDGTPCNGDCEACENTSADECQPEV